MSVDVTKKILLQPVFTTQRLLTIKVIVIGTLLHIVYSSSKDLIFRGHYGQRCQLQTITNIGSMWPCLANRRFDWLFWYRCIIVWMGVMWRPAVVWLVILMNELLAGLGDNVNALLLISHLSRWSVLPLLIFTTDVSHVLSVPYLSKYETSNK